jgi:hypothetical protein
MEVFDVINNEFFLKKHFKKDLLKYIIRNVDSYDFDLLTFLSALEFKSVQCVKLLTNYLELYQHSLDKNLNNLKVKNYYTFDEKTGSFTQVENKENLKNLLEIAEPIDWKKYLFKNSNDTFEDEQEILRILGIGTFSL